MFDIQANQCIVVNPLIEPQHIDSGQPKSWLPAVAGQPQLIRRANTNHEIPFRINVLKRTREIGVLRSIGSSSRQLYRIIIGEGLVICCISWAFNLALAIPASWYIRNMFGRIFFETSLDFAYTIQGPFFSF